MDRVLIGMVLCTVLVIQLFIAIVMCIQNRKVRSESKRRKCRVLVRVSLVWCYLICVLMACLEASRLL